MSHVIDTRRVGGDLVILGGSMVLPSVIPSPLVLAPPDPVDGSIRYNPHQQYIEFYVGDWQALAAKSDVDDAIGMINSHLIAIDEIITDLQTTIANSLTSILEYISNGVTNGNTSLLSLAAAIIAEQTRAQAAEMALDARISNTESEVATLTTSVQTLFQNNQTLANTIASEVLDRQTAINSLRDELLSAISSGSAIPQPYDISFEFTGKTVGADEVIGLFEFPRSVTFNGNFSPSVAYAATQPTNDISLTIMQNDIPVGIIEFMAGQSSGTFYSDVSPVMDSFTYSAGDIMSIVAPTSSDPTFANVTITISGSR